MKLGRGLRGFVGGLRGRFYPVSRHEDEAFYRGYSLGKAIGLGLFGRSAQRGPVAQEEDGPYEVGNVECWSCGHSWVAARPAAQEEVAVFECPSCGEMMGAALGEGEGP